jgi:hypothetical protein
MHFENKNIIISIIASIVLISFILPAVSAQSNINSISPSSCQTNQSFQIANTYLISKVGQSYFNSHYAPIGIDTEYNQNNPTVYYNYTLDGITYNIKTDTGESVQGADIAFMDVTLNPNCTQATGATAVLSQINTTISTQQAQVIAVSQGDGVKNITPYFIRTFVNPEEINMTPAYYVETNKSCTAFIINAVNENVTGPFNNCPQPLSNSTHTIVAIQNTSGNTTNQLNITILPVNQTISVGQNITFFNITFGGSGNYISYSYSIKGYCSPQCLPTYYPIRNNTITFYKAGNYTINETVKDNLSEIGTSNPAHITVIANQTNSTVSATTTIPQTTTANNSVFNTIIQDIENFFKSI